MSLCTFNLIFYGIIIENGFFQDNVIDNDYEQYDSSHVQVLMTSPCHLGLTVMKYERYV